jgi:septal ring factor EnvC (AmiA/AmiB activator)
MPRRELLIILPTVLITLLAGGAVTWLVARQFSGQRAQVESLRERVNQLEQQQQISERRLRLLDNDLKFVREQAAEAQRKLSSFEQSMRFLEAALTQPPPTSRRLAPLPSTSPKPKLTKPSIR